MGPSSSSDPGLGAARPPVVCVVGSINLDLVVATDHLPSPGETVLGDRVVESGGGKGANQAVAAARGGASVAMCGCLGDDRASTTLREQLHADFVDTRAVGETRTSSGMAFITVDVEGDNQIVVASGANRAVDEAFVRAALDDGFLRDASVLLAPMETPVEGIAAAFGHARAQGVTTILNAAPAGLMPDGLMACVDVLVTNRGEISALSGEDDLDRAIGWARTRVPVVVVTLGERGAVVADERGRRDIEPVVITPVDSVGAGDTFCGWLAAEIALAGATGDRLHGELIDAVVEAANAAGAWCATKPGARSAPSRDELDSFRRGRT